MFGVPKVEADLFERVPATHVAIEKGGGEGSNESRAFRDYPTIMTNAPLIATYYLRGYPVNIYLISNTSPNPSARAYEPSLYEQAAIYLTIGKIDSAAYLLDKFESMSPPSIAAISLQDKIALARKDSEKHIRLLEMLTSLDDGNFIYWWMLAESYLRIQPPRALAAFGALKRAIALKPDEKRLLSQLQQLEPYVSRNH
jgi:tetratricopeptide (TPR) repeat protein